MSTVSNQGFHEHGCWTAVSPITLV